MIRVAVPPATNVAETSITIPDVLVVIDTGRMKEVRPAGPSGSSPLKVNHPPTLV